MGAKSACGVWPHSTEYVGSPLDSMAPLLLCGERRRNESAKQKHCNYITVLTSYQWPRLVRPTGKQRQQWPTPDRRPGALVIISYSIKFLSGAIFSGAQSGWAPTSTQTSTLMETEHINPHLSTHEGRASTQKSTLAPPLNT